MVVSVVTLAAIFIYSMRQKAATDLETYQREETEKVRQSLEAFVGLAYQSIETSYNNIEDKAYVEKMYGHRLQNIVDVAIATVRRRAQQVKTGELSLGQAQKLAIQEIEAMRYDGGTGYIWINDVSLPYPAMIMHPTVPALNGTILNDSKYNCAMGKNQNLFQAMAEVSLANGDGFVDYVWPKPTPNGLVPNVKKLSYVSLFKEWGWILGTGIYLDDVKRDVVQSLKKDIASLRYGGKEGYFWINDNQLPYPAMVMHPTNPSLDGKILDDMKYNCAKGTGQNFFQLMVQKAKKEGSGFVEYMWPKPGSDHDEPKLSYVKHFEPLGWVIGSGVYTDNIDKMIMARQEEIAAEINSLMLTIVLISFLLIAAGSVAALSLANTMTSAIFLVKERLQALADGKSIDRLEAKTKDEIGEMTLSLNNLVDGIGAYTEFAREIGKGNLDAGFTALSSDDTLGNSLIQMRTDLKKVAKEEGTRKWFNEGIALFGDLIRTNNNDLQELCRQTITQLVKYLKANQGALYILEQPDEHKPAYLELKSCYAYGRNKHLSQQIPTGECLLGQAVLEKEYLYLTDIPEGYVKITSGLGEATPKALIIIPLINNEEVQGVIEMASFNLFETHEIEFLHKIAENLSSSVASVKVNEVTKRLLESSQQMAEEIRSQEEELRQNTEELLATQEELNRKLLELEKENMQLNEQLHLKNEKQTEPTKN